MRYKKIIALFLCVLLSFSLISCSSRDPQEMPAGTSEETENQEPLLGPDATDEDLLELLGDDVHVVTEDEYMETLKDIKENTGEYAGQIYQMEGFFIKDGDNPYLGASADGGKAEGSLPLTYMTQEPAEGSRVRITGIVNQGEVDEETVAVLEVLVVENLEELKEAEAGLQENE